MKRSRAATLILAGCAIAATSWIIGFHMGGGLRSADAKAKPSRASSESLPPAGKGK
jgi:hypothetical protein